MTRDAEHTPSPQSVVVPVEDWQHVIGALKNAMARLPMGAAIGNVTDALAKVEHLQAAPALSPEATAREGEAVKGPGDYTMVLTEPQAFEMFPTLASHIERMAVGRSVGALIEWDSFLQALNAALTPAPSAGEVCGLCNGDCSAANPPVLDCPFRARSSAPEAREVEAVAVEDGFFLKEDGSRLMWMREGAVSFWVPAPDESTHPAAPSADKLRIAEEALEPFDRVAQALSSKWADHETHWDGCVRHGLTVGDLRRASEALAALKAEGAK